MSDREKALTVISEANNSCRAAAMLDADGPSVVRDVRLSCQRHAAVPSQ